MDKFEYENDAAEAEYVLIEETLKKTRSLTDRMTTILGTFDRRLVKLESSILPIHKSTQALTSKAGNLDSTVGEIERVLAYYRIVADEEGTIQAGVIGSDVASYYASIQRINEGMDYLKSSRMKSADRSIAQMGQLLKAGVLQLENTFRSMLMDISKPIEPLAYISKNRPVPTTSDRDIDRVRSISKYLSESETTIGARSNAESIYSDVRSTFLERSLNSLSKASIATVERRSSGMYEKGSGGFAIYTKAIIQLLQNEVKIVKRVFSEADTTKTFADTMASALSTYIETGRQVNALVKRNMSQDVFLAYDIVENININAGVFEDLTKRHAGKKDNEVNELLHVVRGTCLRSFPEFIEELKVSSSRTQIVMDGTVSELTISTLSYMRRMSEYAPTVEKLLKVLGDGNWKVGGDSRRFVPISDSPTPILAHYFSDTLDTLSSCLETRSRTLKKPGLSALFLLNNYQHIAKVMQNSDIADIVGKDVVSIYDRNVTKNSAIFLDSWKTVVENLMDVTVVKSGSIKTALAGSGDRQNIKDRFKNFNEEFMDLYRTQRQFSVPDSELKSQLISDLKKMLTPMYVRFLDKYQDSEFSRNKEKYIRYDRNQLEGMIEGLFDPTTVDM